ncbi:hypothetical protein A6A04_17155 [Paramagnetospirillum marisnigri]|uniref:Uncharacterized protein n=1 Tax=Paramagnetospirillum marisnigri TaxID=1285242 RepID=A0A178MRU3_9PROT|nr:hypothetical protein A6A04_17155 [Paramagnetospirillum marisnigri]
MAFAVVALCGVAGSAWAQQKATSSSGPMVITITKTDCSRLIQHQPSADVAYKPGVDVRGRPVASADADPARAEFARKLVPDVLEFPITINPLNYAGRNSAYKSKETTQAAIAAGGGTATAAQSQALASAESKIAGYSGKGLDNTTMSVGTVKYDMAKGSFLFNGEPLLGEDQQKLAEACAKRGVK